MTDILRSYTWKPVTSLVLVFLLFPSHVRYSQGIGLPPVTPQYAKRQGQTRVIS